jgi:uridine phosphorylase
VNNNHLFDSNDAIVNPFKGKHAPDLGSVAVMVSAVSELHTIRRLIIPETDNYRGLYTSRLYLKPQTGATSPVAVVGPYIGAPYAVMLIETLIKWGADKIIVLGLCGSISTDVRIGDIVVPTSALVDEGVSRHYRHLEDRPSPASQSIVHHIKKGLIENGQTFHEGSVWTTDAIYRETVSAVQHFQQKNALAVEMELSALFSVARFRGVEVGAILVVSDELATMQWKPGFTEACFKKACHSVCTVISKLWSCI